MEEFNSIIGYDGIKERLYEILNVLNNPSKFEKLGAQLPKGLLLKGLPGVGKTVLAEAFIKASKRKAYRVVQNSSEDEFIKELTKTFEEAKANVPSIIFLDDMDKYQENKEDEKPFNVLQSLIDSVNKDDVYIVATINFSGTIPDSLLRDGRFDERIEVDIPDNKDAAKLVMHFLEGRPCAKDINPNDVAALYSFHTCAQIKHVINRASIKAAYAGRDVITIDDFINSFFNPDEKEDLASAYSERFRNETAYHEAGHLLVTEACVKGSVGFVTIKKTRTIDGTCRLMKELNRRPYIILSSLGGKAAAEMKFGRLASGASEDLEKAGQVALDGLADNGSGGFNFLNIHNYDEETINGIGQNYAVTFELEQFLRKTKEIVALNMPFLDAAAGELLKKGYLLASEISALEQKYPIDNSPIQGI